MRCKYCGYEEPSITVMAEHVITKHNKILGFHNIKVEVEVKYFYCEKCLIAFSNTLGGKPRTKCPMCNSREIVPMGGTFKRVNGIYFNPSER